MRHMSRTQRIDVAWLNERFVAGDFLFIDCPSEYQGGDIFTKHCIDAVTWSRNLMLIAHFTRAQLVRAGSRTVCPAPCVPTDPVSDQGGTPATTACCRLGFVAVSTKDPRQDPSASSSILFLHVKSHKDMNLKLVHECDHVIVYVDINASDSTINIPDTAKRCQRIFKSVGKAKTLFVIQNESAIKHIWKRGDFKCLAENYDLSEISVNDKSAFYMTNISSSFLKETTLDAQCNISMFNSNLLNSVIKACMESSICTP